MKKIPSVFKRDYEGSRLVFNEVVPGCEWVLAGEGVATRKYDGTAVMIHEGKLYKRYDVKPGRITPPTFIPSQDPDVVTGHWPGWVPCLRDERSDQWAFEALGHFETWLDGTYELCGPKVQGNPEGFEKHVLVPHGFDAIIEDCVDVRSFDGIKQYLEATPIEGIVFHHPDGRMAKIKAKDFGLKNR